MIYSDSMCYSIFFSGMNKLHNEEATGKIIKHIIENSGNTIEIPIIPIKHTNTIIVRIKELFFLLFLLNFVLSKFSFKIDRNKSLIIRSHKIYTIAYPNAGTTSFGNNNTHFINNGNKDNTHKKIKFFHAKLLDTVSTLSNK